MFTAKWEGEPLIIHNAGQRNREDNRLASWGGISGHYRFDASRLDESELIAFIEKY